MDGKIHRFLADDHRRLDAWFECAVTDLNNIDASLYAQFRAGLLKHIGMEEKILLPAAQKWRGGQPLTVAARLRLDHGALTALLVPPPTAPVIAAIRAILKIHNPIEDDTGGIYDQCEKTIGPDIDRVLHQLKNFPEIKVLPHVNNSFVIDAARRALVRAGYELKL